MLIYKDLLSGDEYLSDSYDLKEIEDGFFFEVEGKWVELKDADVDIGANPSAEEAEEGTDSSSRKVVDVVDAFNLSELPSYDKKTFMGHIKPWLGKVVAKLPAEQQDEFKTKAQSAIKFLLGKLKDLQFFTGESMDPDQTLIYAYYSDGATNPTFLYPRFALKEEKC